MDVLSWIKDQEKSIKAVNDEREAKVLTIATDLVALVKLRIQDRGESYQGTPFIPYVPAYAKTRAKAGYQVKYVDFTISGALWNNVQPRVTDKTETTVTVRISAITDRNKDILSGQARKRGNILIPSEEEKNWLRQAVAERLARLVSG